MRLEDIYDRPKPVIVSGDDLLELAGQQRDGKLWISSMSRTKQNGLWSVIIKYASDSDRRGANRRIHKG